MSRRRIAAGRRKNSRRFLGGSQRVEKVFSPRCGGTDLPCRRFHGFKTAYSPSRRFSIVTIWARVQRACGISRLSAPLRIAAFTAHVMASSA